MRKFVEELEIEWQDFRDYRLWMPEVRLLYTMNEGHLRKMYAHYADNNRGHGKKPFNCDWILLEDCYKLFLKDRPLNMGKDAIKYAFVMSKMSVVEETNQEAVNIYEKLLYVEFLEFLARIAEQYFEESEMEELELHHKIEYLLDEILPVVGEKRVK